MNKKLRNLRIALAQYEQWGVRHGYAMFPFAQKELEEIGDAYEAAVNTAYEADEREQEARKVLARVRALCTHPYLMFVDGVSVCQRCLAPAESEMGK